MINSKNINDLHPTVKKMAEELIKRMKDKGYNIGISSTYRDFEEQNWLYAQGRTTPGNIVTNVKAGGSMHNYRLAFDIFNNVKGDLYNSNIINLAGKIGTELGLEWGGSWKSFVDKPHFQYTEGLTLLELKAGKLPKGATKTKILPTLKLNDKNNDVKLLQLELKIICDGIFGKNTETAVKTFQTKNGLIADGIVGAKTWEKLKDYSVK